MFSEQRAPIICTLHHFFKYRCMMITQLTLFALNMLLNLQDKAQLSRGGWPLHEVLLPSSTFMNWCEHLRLHCGSDASRCCTWLFFQLIVKWFELRHLKYIEINLPFQIHGFFYWCPVFCWVISHRGWNKTWQLYVMTAAYSAVMGLGAKAFGWCHKCHQLFTRDFAKTSVVAKTLRQRWHFNCHVGFHSCAWDNSCAQNDRFRFSADPRKMQFSFLKLP